MKMRKWDSKRLLILLLTILQVTAVGFIGKQWDIVKIVFPMEIALISWYIKNETDRPTGQGEKNNGSERIEHSGKD